MYGSDGVTVLRIFSPLTGDIYKKDQLGEIQPKYERMPLEGLCDYLQDIQRAIQCEYLENEGANGLTVYLEQKNLKRKVLTMIPSAELWEDQLWSVMEIRSTEKITKEEETALIHMWEKQVTGAFGDRILLHTIYTDQGELYLNLWNDSEDFVICPEAELKRTHSMNGIEKMRWVKTLIDEKTGGTQQITVGGNENLCIRSSEACQVALSLAMVWNHKSGQYDCEVKGYTQICSGYQNAEGVKKLAEAYQQIGELIDLIEKEKICMTEEELHLFCQEIAEEEITAGPGLQVY